MGKAKASAAESAPRGGRERRIAEVLPAVGDVAFRRFGFVQSSIIRRWGEIVGARYAEVSVPETLRFPPGKRADGVLTLSVCSAHAVTIQHVVPEIIARVNRFFGYAAVAKVLLRQGMVTAPAETAPKLELVALPATLGDSLKSIADPELKAVLESLARGIETRDIAVMGKVR